MSLFSDFDPEITISNKFPGKLWRIVNSCRSGAIGWGQNGHTVIIHQTKFQSQYLDPPNSLFKTINIGSFIRQLNLYGFRKLNALRYSDSNDEIREVHEFQNDFFVRGRPELLTNLRRNVGIRRSRELAVKRRMDALHPSYASATSMTSKRPRYFEEFGGPAMQSILCPVNESSSSSSASSSSSSQLTLQATQTGQWPVFVQWDGKSYKYVILPDASSTRQLPQHQQPQQHPEIYAHHPSPSPHTLQPPPPLHPAPYHHHPSHQHHVAQQQQQFPHFLHPQHHDYAKVMLSGDESQIGDASKLPVIQLADGESSSQDYYLVHLLPPPGVGHDSDDSTQASEYADFLSSADPVMASGGQASSSQSPKPGSTPSDYSKAAKDGESDVSHISSDLNLVPPRSDEPWDLSKHLPEASRCNRSATTVSPAAVKCTSPHSSPALLHAMQPYYNPSFSQPGVSAENFGHFAGGVSGILMGSTLSPGHISIKTEGGLIHYDAGIVGEVDKSEMDVYIRDSSTDSTDSRGSGRRINPSGKATAPFNSPNLRMSQEAEPGDRCDVKSPFAAFTNHCLSPRVKVLVEAVPHIEIRPEFDYCTRFIKEEMGGNDISMCSQ